MKLIRLSEDRYILDAGPEVTPAHLDEIGNYWREWWAREITAPETMVIGGSEIPLEYEDRREPDIESRLRALEEHIHFTEIDHGWTRGPIPPITKHEPPLGGIEQYQAEDR